MALIKTLKDKTPQFGKNIFLAETATIIGDFTCGDDCSIWYNAVVRGDVNFIKLGNKVNIETDILIDYINNNKSKKIKSGSKISIDFLKLNGF